jgi:hypothetical protein
VGKKIYLLLLLILVLGCQADIAGPMPEYSNQGQHISSHRRIPQSVHGRTGVISDLVLETLRGSERLHIGNRQDDSNESLPAYELSYTREQMIIKVYALSVLHQRWAENLEGFAAQSQLIHSISWQMAEEDLYLELTLEFSQPVVYRSWYYVNASFFTIEITVSDPD